MIPHHISNTPKQLLKLVSTASHNILTLIHLNVNLMMHVVCGATNGRQAPMRDVCLEALVMLVQAQRASERGAETDVLAAKQALLEAQQELQNATRERDALLASSSQVQPVISPHIQMIDP